MKYGTLTEKRNKNVKKRGEKQNMKRFNFYLHFLMEQLYQGTCVGAWGEWYTLNECAQKPLFFLCVRMSWITVAAKTQRWKMTRAKETNREQSKTKRWGRCSSSEPPLPSLLCQSPGTTATPALSVQWLVDLAKFLLFAAVEFTDGTTWPATKGVSQS